MTIGNFVIFNLMKKRRFTWILLLSIALLIKLFSLFPDAVEKYYSQGLYVGLARFWRILFGWAPFSVGDILYGTLIIWLLITAVKIFRKIRNKQADSIYWKTLLANSIRLSLVVYIAFNLFWGLNYNRKGIAWQLGLDTAPIEKQDLVAVMQLLRDKVNSLDTVAHQRREAIDSKRYLFDGAVAAYKQLAGLDKRFEYPSVSLKPSLFSYLGNYLGYTGYYNPLTGEAQVNTTVPLFIQPFTSCHEIGHQLGYAKENEANFAGYLAASASTDTLFQYSVYFDLYSYGRPYLYYQDSMLLKKLDSTLNKGVRNDFRELKKFAEKHANPIEVVIDKLYGQYLKANEQPDGKVTYGKVMVWLVARYKKSGII